MFSSTALFKGTLCPELLGCDLPNCIFGHNVGPPTDALQSYSTPENSNGSSALGKRKRANGELPQNSGHSTPDNVAPEDSELQQSGTSKDEDSLKVPASTNVSELSDISQSRPQASKRTISPPPLRRKAKPSDQDGVVASAADPATSPRKMIKAPNKELKKESLNPRLVPRTPAAHSTRLAILKALYKELDRLNKELLAIQGDSDRELLMSDQEVITAALDEEEKVAKDQPTVYSNVIKLRIHALKKMTVADWRKAREELVVAASKATNHDSNGSNVLPSVDTGLEKTDELVFLSRLTADQGALQKHGYVVSVPNEGEIASARAGIEAAQNFEICDRCKTRFQVFPGRRSSDGALTTGGKCVYHYGKAIYPPKSKSDAITGHRGQIFSCCGEDIGQSAGCTTAETHVFKVSDPKRLAAVMNFEQTQENERQSIHRALAIDCEMGYTVHGLELIRLTATSWPSGEEVLDILVRPQGEILDLNTRFSGVLPEAYTNAPAFSSSDSSPTTQNVLPLVPSPTAARSILFDLISPSSFLIGHALENDLNALRVIHPRIVDTVTLFPHPRGLPLRFGLKMLVARHLGVDIQTAGAKGHDSKEDARAAGELVRWRIARDWKSLRREGWSVKDGRLLPPNDKTEQADVERSGEKRKRGPEDGEVAE